MSNFLNAANEVESGKQLAINHNEKQVFGVPVKLVKCQVIKKNEVGKAEIDTNYPDIIFSFKGTDPKNDGYLNDRIFGNVFNTKHQYYNEHGDKNTSKMLMEFLSAFIPVEQFKKGLEIATKLTPNEPNPYIAIIKAFFGGDKPIFNEEFAKTVKDVEVLIVLNYKGDKIEINRDKFGKIFSTEILPQPLAKKVDGKYIKVKPIVPDTEPDTSDEDDGINLPEESSDDLPF